MITIVSFYHWGFWRELSRIHIIHNSPHFVAWETSQTVSEKGTPLPHQIDQIGFEYGYDGTGDENGNLCKSQVSGWR